jgi:hypothetical protein
MPPELSGKKSRLSPAYILMASPHCFRLLAHCARIADAFALARAGSNIAARMAIMAITTNNSIKVNAFWLKRFSDKTEVRVHGQFTQLGMTRIRLTQQYEPDLLSLQVHCTSNRTLGASQLLTEGACPRAQQWPITNDMRKRSSFEREVSCCARGRALSAKSEMLAPNVDKEKAASVRSRFSGNSRKCLLNSALPLKPVQAQVRDRSNFHPAEQRLNVRRGKSLRLR